MGIHYNRFAGNSLARLAALSDGVFAVAMTLLVLDVRPPAPVAVHTEHDLWVALLAIWPRLVTFVLSVMTLGIFWVGQQAQLSAFARADRRLTWIHISFLLVVSLMPFSTALLSSFITYRLALVAYWVNLLLLGVVLFFAWRYALHAGLVDENLSPELVAAIERRIVVAQSLYAFCALLCVFGTYYSIAGIVLLQLNYAIAPAIGFLKRL